MVRLLMVNILLAFLLNAACMTAAQGARLQDLLNAARAFEKQQNYAAAEAAYKKALEMAPNNVKVMKRLGILFQTELKLQASIDLFKCALAQDPEYPQVNFFAGVSYYGINRYSKAIESFQRELETSQPHPRCRYYLALAYEAEGKVNDAIEQLNRLISQNPKDLDALYQLARLYKDASFQVMEMLRKEGPDSFQLHALMGELYADEARYPDAIRAYRAALAKRADATGLHYAIGVAYWAEHGDASAQKEFLLALKEDPGDPLTNLYLGDIAAQQGQYAQALNYLKIAEAGQPRMSRVHELVGECYENLGRFQNAKSELIIAEDLNPNDPQTHYLLARVYQQIHEPEASQHELKLFEKLSLTEKTNVASRRSNSAPAMLKRNGPR